jgi:hypothetical protein
MAILTKGQTFTSTDTVTNVKLHNLVDNAAFVAGSSGTCASNGGLEVSSGQLQIANNGVTVAKLSAGAPSWDSSSNLTITGNAVVNGTVTTGGTISTSGNLAVNGTATIAGVTTLNGASAVNANMTVNAQIVRFGTASDRTVQLVTGSESQNAISFGWDNGDLLVTVDGDEFKVTLTAV